VAESEPDELDELLRAVANRHRRQILRDLWGRERGAGEVAERLGLAPATASEHLRVLRKTGLVTMRIDGTYRLYQCRAERVHLLRALLADAFPAVDRTPEEPHPLPGPTRSPESRTDQRS